MHCILKIKEKKLTEVQYRDFKFFELKELVEEKN